jgi:hypothetical protein
MNIAEFSAATIRNWMRAVNSVASGKPVGAKGLNA